MRLHHLEITAFGPFADTVEVDFDRLSAGQVFLLSGDTGSGKTSVLDAICFALYGDVPGDRATARQLRSHHAAPGTAPRVVLEATVAGRRMRFTRSPAWRRPKKRGTGTTTEQARVTIEQRSDDTVGAWTLRSNRLDEAGHLVTELMGMTLAQFSQVVLLPQNQFDRFLHAGSEDRQRVLTRLFRTARFERVERWFADHRRELHRSTREHNGTVAAVLHRISETAGDPLPEAWDHADLAPVVDAGLVAGWAADVVRGHEDLLGRAEQEERSARTVRDRLRRELDAARRTCELRERHERARADLATLAESAAEAEGAGRQLREAELAGTVAPYLELADRDRDASVATARAAEELLVHAGAAVHPEPGALEEPAVPDHADRCAAALAEARSMLPRAAALHQARERAGQCRDRLQRFASALDEARERLTGLPAEEAEATTDLAAARELVAAEPARREALLGSRRLLAAGEDRDALTVQVSGARARLADQRERRNTLKDDWLQLRERRIVGMAAELASVLASGQGCPVCGSREHPSPAVAGHDAPSPDEEERARGSLDDAEVALAAVADQVQGLQARLAGARALVEDRPLHELRAAVRTCEQEVAACSEAEQARHRAEARVAELTALRQRLEAQLLADEKSRSGEAATLAELEDRIAAEGRELDRVLAGADDITIRIESLQQQADLLERVREALQERDRCADRADRAGERARREAQTLGFDDAASARDAVLDEQSRAALRARLHERERRRDGAERVLAEAEVVAAAGQEPPDLTDVEARYAAADDALGRATGSARSATDRVGRLRQLAEELERALAVWQPVRTEHARVAALAELVEGRGSDNQHRMRLSAYVLAARLGQVVDAANERLAPMSDGRYLLEHTDARSAGDRRGGLGLRLLDQWTDERRDPATLSGGETFVTSLALALGLADVVTAESGGQRIDTLFVDEGFGSLDADTLELVMDCLDRLREGGRVVGVVSHVAEMRDRIPTRLEVHKGRSGSRLCIRGG